MTYSSMYKASANDNWASCPTGLATMADETEDDLTERTASFGICTTMITDNEQLRLHTIL